ncbi:MAG: acyl-ACP thioesterase domain-containing protein [Bacteroidota bacterium]
MKQDSLEIYSGKFKVCSYMLDPGKRLSIPALFSVFGEAAHFDAGRRGWGYQEMIDRSQAWVLIRVRIEVNRMPGWEEEVILKTWPKTMEGVLAFRDFEMLDSSEQILAAGSTVWTLIDLESRRPVRMTGVEYDTGKLAEISAINNKPAKISWPEDLVTVNRLKARYSQLDMNLHVNNARYLEWVINEVPMNLLLNQEIKTIEVNFMSEVKANDELEILTRGTSVEEGEFQGFIRRLPSDQPVFAARLAFS